MRRTLTAALTLLGLAFAGINAAMMVSRTSEPKRITAAVRLSAVKRAKVWNATNIPAMDLRAGPQGKDAFEPFAAVACTYVERKMDGATPKFTCRLASGDEVKVKYGADNVEVSGEVAASRLLWALGFGADHWYPVSVTCHSCPTDPHKDKHPRPGDAVFAVAAIERNMPGATIESKENEGWKWPELKLVDPSKGGATLAERDALTLLAVLLQHTDNKAQQQRLICLPGGAGADGVCTTPFMFIHDVGLTFGKANLHNGADRSGVNFPEWSATPIWRDAKTCVGHLSKALTGSMGDPVISEAGRVFLGGLLTQLSDAQLRDLFTIARFPDYSHVSVDDWVAAFTRKRDQITHRSPCV